MKIVLENNEIIVLWKKSFELSSPLKSRSNVLDEARKRFYEDLYTVNRLDFKASGLLILAKSKNVRDQLRKRWSQAEKKYRVLTASKLKLGTYRFKVSRRGHKVFLHYSRDSNKGSFLKAHLCISIVLFSRKIAKGVFVNLIRNVTGFTHQIRMLAKKNDTQVLGEDLYSKVRDSYHGIAIECFFMRLPWYSTGTTRNYVNVEERMSESMRNFLIETIKWNSLNSEY